MGVLYDKAVTDIAQVNQSISGDQTNQASVVIYVSNSCSICTYTYEIVNQIRYNFPKVDVHLVDIHETQEAIPDLVFATPTYLLNGRVWSLGNPSLEKVNETFQKFV